MSGRAERASIHVLVVDDSAVVRQVMAEILLRESRVTVAVASDPLIALGHVSQCSRSERSLAGAQDNQTGLQLEAEDLVDLEAAIVTCPLAERNE